MALFTDGNPADIEYLRSYESGILDVAETEGIDLGAKLTLAAEEIGNTLLVFVTRQGSPDVQLRRRQVGLTAVVTTPALRRWHATRTLVLIYRDAFGMQLNERYANKVTEYTAVSKQAEEELFQIGIGLSTAPVEKAGQPNVGSAVVNANTYFIRVSWVNGAGNEGVPSDATAGALSAGATVTAPAVPNSRIAGWNIYAGISADTVTLQNFAPLAIGANWTFTGAIVAGGAPAGNGQIADYFLVDHHITLRG